MIIENIELINYEKNYKLSEIMSFLETDLSSTFYYKKSKEKKSKGKEVISPKSLNEGYKNIFSLNNYKSFKPFQDECEIDFYKDRIGIEIQFGKYAFVVYDLFAKFKVCYENNIIDLGVEVIPSKNLAKNMSSGVPSFISVMKSINRMNIDFPVCIIGVNLKDEKSLECGVLPI